MRIVDLLEEERKRDTVQMEASFFNNCVECRWRLREIDRQSIFSKRGKINLMPKLKHGYLVYFKIWFNHVLVNLCFC